MTDDLAAPRSPADAARPTPGPAPGPAPAPADHLRAVEVESARFRAVLAGAAPGTRVPSCPDWDVDDLLHHLTEVQWFWAEVLARRPLGPDDEGFPDAPARPEGRAALLAAAADATARLVEELRAADPAEEAWSWSDDHTVGFTLRRQAHEALVHRLDAELAVGDVTDLPPALAADGVLEVLDVVFGAAPPFGTWSPRDAWVRVDLTDTGHCTWVQVGWFEGTAPGSGEVLDGHDVRVRPDPGHEPHAVVSGRAADVDAWLWSRTGDDAVTQTGDADVLARFREATSHPVE